MRSMKSIILKWLPVMALCLAMSACDVAEDESDCVVTMQLTFRFTKDDGLDHFGNEVPSLSVFVFDENRKFVTRLDENDNSKFGTSYTMPVSLMPGDYTFVVWGGLKDTNYYLCSSGQSQGQAEGPSTGQTAMSEMLLRLKCDTRNSHASQKHFVDYVPSSLFFGRTAQVTLVENQDNTVTIDLAKNSNVINLTVIGLPESITRANPYPYIDIYMDSPNGGYDFWNGLETGGNAFTWVQHDAASGGGNIQTSTLHSLRMIYGNAIKLTIYNTETAKAIYTADLLEDYIRKVPAYSSQAALDLEDEFDITIDLQAYLGVNVTVNGWDVGVSGNVIH